MSIASQLLRRSRRCSLPIAVETLESRCLPSASPALFGHVAAISHAPQANQHAHVALADPVADLSVSITSGPPGAYAGGFVVFNVTVTNAGPSATLATVSTLANGASGLIWLGAYAGGGADIAAGTGNVSATVSLAAGQSAVFTSFGHVAAGSGQEVSAFAFVSGAGTSGPTPGDDLAATSFVVA